MKDSEAISHLINQNNVNKPHHYEGRNGLEAIDVIKNFVTLEQERGFYLCNAIKYIIRFQSKNGLEDLKKANIYLNWLIESYE